MSSLYKNHLSSESTKLSPPISDAFFVATVVDTDPVTYCVTVAPQSSNKKGLQQGIPLTSQLSKLMGMKDCLLPSIGSNVLCLQVRATYCYIIGTIPSPDLTYGSVGFPARSALGAGDGSVDEANTVGYGGESETKRDIFNSNRPTDIVDGEFVKANEFGVLLGLFQTFATLKGSELAQIQAFVFDDLVRIISHNFHHITSMGEVSISHDGQGLNLEYTLTHDPKEALGRAQVSSESYIPVLEQITSEDNSDDNSNYKLKEDPRIKAIERLKIFVGKLGDLVRIMLVRPAEGKIRSLDGKPIEVPDTGLFDFHLGLDGGAIVRTVKGLALEKTNWIRVPHRIRTPEDPEGDEAQGTEEFKYEEKEAFEFDNTYTYQEQPFFYFLQIRDYVSYMNETYGMKNFKTHEKDFHVNDDVTKEQPLATGDVVKVDPLSNTRYEKRTSGFYMMPNGGIMLKDAWGSALVMEGGNIYVQAAKDEIHQPMRNYISKAGQYTNFSSRKDIDFSSTEGGSRLKTKKVQHFYSQEGGIILQTDVKAGIEFSPEGEAIETTAGIVMKSAAGIYSKAENYYIRSAGPYAVRANDLILQGDGQARLIGEKDMMIFSPESLSVGTKGTLSLVSSEGSTILFGDTATVVGTEDQTIGLTPFGPALGLMTRDESNNGVDQYKAFIDTLDEFKAQNFTYSFKEDEKWDDLKFRFLKGDKYSFTTNQDAIPQTISQIEADTFEALDNLVVWEEEMINGTYPYPGLENEACLVGAELKNVELIENELYNKADSVSMQELNKPKSIFSEYKIIG